MDDPKQNLSEKELEEINQAFVKACQEYQEHVETSKKLQTVNGVINYFLLGAFLVCIFQTSSWYSHNSLATKICAETCGNSPVLGYVDLKAKIFHPKYIDIVVVCGNPATAYAVKQE